MNLLKMTKKKTSPEMGGGNAAPAPNKKRVLLSQKFYGSPTRPYLLRVVK